MHVGRSLASAFTAIAALVASSGLVSASCPYPLGLFAAEGRSTTWNWTANSTDIEGDIFEATLVHGQKWYGTIVNVAGNLNFVYNAEVEWELEDGTPKETQAIYFTAYSNETGWDVPIQYLASDDPTVEIPEGRNVQPSATALGDTLWTVWDSSGHITQNGSNILLRGHNGAGFTSITGVSFDSASFANKLPKIVTVGASTYIAFQSNALSLNRSDEFQIFGRTFDGTTLGPIETISTGMDGWADQTVALGTDGSRVFAVWAAQNTSFLGGEGEWVAQAAVRDASGQWSPVINLTEPSRSGLKTPAVAGYGGRVYAAWVTNDPAFDARGDYDLYMRSFDPVTRALSPILKATGDDFQRDESFPALFEWSEASGGDGKLHLLWSSNSAPAGIATSGTDDDIYYRTFDGSVFGPVRLVSDPLDNGFFEALPGFFTVDGALHAYFLSNLCLPGCPHETDWREMTRLLARPARPYDDVRAAYTLPSGNASTSAQVSFSHANGSAVEADAGYMVKLSNGTVVAVSLTDGSAAVPITYNASLTRQLTATYCGAPLVTTETNVPAPPAGGAPPPSSTGAVVAVGTASLILVAAAAWVFLRRKAA